MWQNLARKGRSSKIFLSNTLLCWASKASDFSYSHSLAFTCFLVRRWYSLFLNFLWPVQRWLFWMWNKILIYISRNNSASLLHVAHSHQKWLPIDFIHFSRILQEASLLEASNLFLMFLTKCQTSNWWLIFGTSSLMNFLICVCRSIVICSGIIPWTFKKVNPFGLNPQPPLPVLRKLR